eukprot:scaffold4659_cov125-Isochrysis_galbana.AAC.12
MGLSQRLLQRGKVELKCCCACNRRSCCAGSHRSTGTNVAVRAAAPLATSAVRDKSSDNFGSARRRTVDVAAAAAASAIAKQRCYLIAQRRARRQLSPSPGAGVAGVPLRRPRSHARRHLDAVRNRRCHRRCGASSRRARNICRKVANTTGSPSPCRSSIGRQKESYASSRSSAEPRQSNSRLRTRSASESGRPETLEKWA